MANFVWTQPSQAAALCAAGTDAYRLCSGEEGFAERLGDDAMIGHRSGRARDEILAGLDRMPWRPARVFARPLPRRHHDRAGPVLLRGDASLPPVGLVREAGVLFGLDFESGPSHGLFLDQRANRARLRHAAPRRLLNVFAYTCSFSVVAALTGAATVSVDLSKKSLERGRENFRRNAIDPASGHRFLADDALDVIPRLVRRGETFDAIVLDPPTFSRGNRGRLWQVEEHFEALLAAALDLAAAGAAILLSTNCTGLDPRALENMARACLDARGRKGKLHREPALPDFPEGHGASTVWLTLAPG